MTVACGQVLEEEAPGRIASISTQDSATAVEADEAPTRTEPLTTQPPITSLDLIDPPRCNFVHNINACFSDEEPPEGIPLGDLSGVFFLAQNDLFRRLGVDDPVRIKAVEETEWSDTSLGLPEPGTSYDQVIVQGFKLTLEDESGTAYVYHTSLEEAFLAEPEELVEAGIPRESSDEEPVTIIRQPPVSILDTINPDECSFVHNIDACFSDGSVPEGVLLDEYMDLYLVSRGDLSERTGVEPEFIKIKSVENVEWNDSSLGNPEPGMLYLQVITPGFRLVLEAKDKLYTYHTSMDRTVLVD